MVTAEGQLVRAMNVRQRCPRWPRLPSQQVLAAENKEDHKHGDENQPECDRGAKLISARYEATAATIP